MRPVQGYLGVGEEVFPAPPVCRVLLENVVHEVCQDGHSVGPARQVLEAVDGAEEVPVDGQDGAVPWESKHLRYLGRPHGCLECVQVRYVRQRLPCVEDAIRISQGEVLRQTTPTSLPFRRELRESLATATELQALQA